MPNLVIAQPSCMSLLLEFGVHAGPFATGTGFVVQSPPGPMLITNWHNLAGRHPQTGQPMSPSGAIPDRVRILHNRAERLGEWVYRTESLINPDGSVRWRELPLLPNGNRVDVVALPLTQLDDVGLYPYALTGQADIAVGPAEIVSVLGFPFGVRAGGALAVWATGFVASEPDVDYDAMPVFLIDSRTRPGQSGSAVIAYRAGGAIRMADGGTAIFGGPVWKLLGVYSGRVNEQLDLGLVWKTSVIQQLIA